MPPNPPSAVSPMRGLCAAMPNRIGSTRPTMSSPVSDATPSTIVPQPIGIMPSPISISTPPTMPRQLSRYVVSSVMSVAANSRLVSGILWDSCRRYSAISRQLMMPIVMSCVSILPTNWPSMPALHRQKLWQPLNPRR